MNPQHLKYLRCPFCHSTLTLRATTTDRDGSVAAGVLDCAQCDRSYPIAGHIPRFVPIQNYASGFGLEWTRHARSQYDSFTGQPVSENRFFAVTRWPRQLLGEVILEVGSGSGRFTEQAASTGGMVVSLDLSYAVEANWASNGRRPNVLIVQGDVYQMPFSPGTFDRIFCFGMLQHTPNPREAFRSLLPFGKPGASIVVDVYKKTFGSFVLGTKYWVRPITRRINPERLYRWVRGYINVMWPLASLLRRIPKVGKSLNWRLLVADYSADGLQRRFLKEWAYLDTFDMLSPRYDYPQTLKEVRRWFDESELTDVEVEYGYNGIEGRGKSRGRHLNV
jgi:SAM-dependent methyltransferase